MGGPLERAVHLAAAAATLEELGSDAAAALGDALEARAVFLTRIAPSLTETTAIAEADAGTFAAYVRGALASDPLWWAAVRLGAPVCALERHVDRRTVEASRAYREFHRPHDFEHHLLVRLEGPSNAAPGSLLLGLTRGRRGRAFDHHDVRAAELALPAFSGAAARLSEARGVGPIARRARLTPAEATVLAHLRAGASNPDIASRLGVSRETVKTHVARILRKLGVRSRAEAIVLLHSPRSSRLGLEAATGE